ncbi:MAG: DNA polymerase III subunit delta [Hyphomicrobiaceae bacterium]
MVAVKAAQAAAFLKSPPQSLSAVLFYGSDPGLVSERSDRLAKLMAAREDPAGEILRLDDTDLDSDPDRLGVELDTRPMFSGRKIIRATAGRRIAAASLKPILEVPAHEGFLIVEAGNLKPTDALRSLFEGKAHAAAVACYADDTAAIDGLITEVLSQFRVKITLEAREELNGRLGADRALSRAEIEKLALYAMGQSEITLNDVEAVVGDASDLALERIPEAAASGDVARAVGDLSRAVASGESPQAIILITQRYFLKLHRIRGDIETGRGLEDALRALRPPLHFKQRDIFASQLRRWNRAGLDQALRRIAEAAKAARLSSQLEETLAERLILALSAMAGGTLGSSPSRTAQSGAARRRS